jgi:DNA-binding Lrp family transcriptional regulator
MSLFSTGHDVVDQVGSVHLEGNILPTSWFSTFVLESGKPDLNAIVVLSEIVYWHRPTVVRDEYSGQVVRVKKKFKSDLLQRSYQSFSDQYGFSKQQVKEAFDRLEKYGVLKRHFRTIEANNQKYNNVLFIELITPVLFEMTTLPLSKGELIDYLIENADNSFNFLTGEAPNFDEKITFNNLSDLLAARLISNYAEVYKINDFLDVQGDDLSQSLSLSINKIYKEISSSIPLEDEERSSLIYLALREALIPKFAKKDKLSKRSYTSIAEIIIAKFFSRLGIVFSRNSFLAVGFAPVFTTSLR